MLAFASSTNVSQSIFVPPNMLPKRRIAASSSGRHEAWFALALASDTVHCFFAPMDRYVGAAARFAASFADIAHEEGAARVVAKMHLASTKMLDTWHFRGVAGARLAF